MADTDVLQACVAEVCDAWGDMQPPGSGMATGKALEEAVAIAEKCHRHRAVPIQRGIAKAASRGIGIGRRTTGNRARGKLDGNQEPRLSDWGVSSGASGVSSCPAGTGGARLAGREAKASGCHLGLGRSGHLPGRAERCARGAKRNGCIRSSIHRGRVLDGNLGGSVQRVAVSGIGRIAGRGANHFAGILPILGRQCGEMGSAD